MEEENALPSTRDVLPELIAGSGAVGTRFFEALVEHLAAALGVAYVITAERIDDDLVQVLGFWERDHLAAPRQYDVRHTPCEQVIRAGKVTYYPQRVSELFPNDTWLVEMHAYSYLGVPLVDSANTCIGHLCVIGTEPINDWERACGVLATVAARAAGEIMRSRVERELRESEARYQRLAEATSEGIAVHRNGLILEANPRFAQMYGYDLDELVGKDAMKLAHPDSRPAILDRINTNSEEPLEGVSIRKDGSTFPVWTCGRAVMYKGEPARVIIVRDITNQKQAEAALRASEARYRTLMEQASDGIFVAGVDGRFEEVNAAGCAMLGYTLEELQAMRPGDLIDPADLSGNPLHIDDVMAGEVVITERNLRRKNGSLVPVEISSRRLDDGRVQGIVRDISGRRRSEEALRQSEERLRDLVHNARDAILTLDIEGRFTSANRAAERLLGFKTGELMGCDLADLAAGGAIESVSRLVDTTDTSQSSIRELSLRTHDGRQIWLEATRRVIRRDGKPVEVHVIARDVTERRELQEQLWQSQKMDAIGRLAGGVAHDLNNLLTVISCYNDLTLKRAAEGAPGHREAIGIRQACERAARLTRQLLTFSRKTVSEPRSVDINGVVEQMRDMLGRLIGEHIRLRTATDPALGSVRLDAGQLEQIIVNLAINARDAMPEGGVLTIATAKLEPGSSIAGRMMAERSAKCALLVVSDTGIGMDADTQSRAFEPFFTTKEAGKGTGLGLSTVYGIVNQAGGMVRLQSEPGRGTRVEVYLPTSEAVVYRAGVDSRGRPSGGTETVLVVEDEEMVRQLVCEVLQGAGFTVLEASNGREAMRLMEATSSAIDLVVTDVIMPEMSGSELAKQLERSRPEIKILFMSGYTDDAIIHHGVLEEGLEFLAKPFSPDELLARVRGVLDAR